MKLTRRDLFRAAAAMPFAHYEALAAPARQQVKITAIKALQLKQRGTLIRVETDAGISPATASATGTARSARSP